MMLRLVANTAVFLCTAVAWVILGSTIQYRSTIPVDHLRSQVVNTWGSPHEQRPPVACFNDMQVTREVSLESSKIAVDLELEHRQKGLLWFSTYKVNFAGTYRFRNATDREQFVEFTLFYPAKQATYDALVFTIDGSPVPNHNAEGSVRGSKSVRPGEVAEIFVSYRSQGLDRWTYDFAGQPAHVRNFDLEMTTNFKEMDFPENTLSPSTRQETPNGWSLRWNYSSLLTAYTIAMEMPAKLQPGPLAGQISYFAPVSLFFFFFLLFIITTLRNIDLHPMNYFFLAAAFFAFHLLLAYLVDHLSIHASFIICSLVSVFLVVSYLRVVVNTRFAVIEAAGAQFVYLVLFSYAFFFKGFTGLSVTVGAIITLFVVMQLTARMDWTEKFKRPPRPANAVR